MHFLVDNNLFKKYLKEEAEFEKGFIAAKTKLKKEFNISNKSHIGNSARRLYLSITEKDMPKISKYLNIYGMVKEDSALNNRYLELTRDISSFKKLKYWEWYNWDGTIEDMCVTFFYNSDKIYACIDTPYKTEIPPEFKEITRTEYNLALYRYRRFVGIYKSLLGILDVIFNRHDS